MLNSVAVDDAGTALVRRAQRTLLFGSDGRDALSNEREDVVNFLPSRGRKDDKRQMRSSPSVI